jgi:SsrA-binding protein
MADLKNKQAFHEYIIDSKYEAGMVLLGTEIKSLRSGKISFNDSYCLIEKGEIWIKSLHISEYSHGTTSNHDPLRIRKLLLHKREIRKIEAKLKVKGHTIIPLRIFFNEKDFAKIEIGLAKGKKLHDKRENIRQKDVEREIRRSLK